MYVTVSLYVISSLGMKKKKRDKLRQEKCVNLIKVIRVDREYEGNCDATCFSYILLNHLFYWLGVEYQLLFSEYMVPAGTKIYGLIYVEPAQT